jgi:hypothetical protein
MASLPVVITSAKVEIFWNNLQYKEVADVSFTVDYGEEEIYGIDSQYAQEIAGGRISVSGQVNGFRLRLSNGLQAKNLRSLFSDVTASPYVSLRISDRQTSEDLIFIPQCKINSETYSIPNKGTVKLNFSFKGMVPFFPLDRS